MAEEGAFLKVPLTERDHLLGAADAPVEIVEYGDFECGFCREAYPVLEEVRAALGERLVFAFRHFPLSTIHSKARRAAEIAEAAAMQGKFWEVYHRLYTHELELEGEELERAAVLLGIDPLRLERDIRSENVVSRLREDFRSGVRSGVNGTPTFFINGGRYDGEFTVEGFLRAAGVSSASDLVSIGTNRSRIPIRTTERRSEGDQSLFLERLEGVSGEAVHLEELEEVFRIASHPSSNDLQVRAAILLSELYPFFSSTNREFARKTHALLLRELKEPRRTFGHPSCGRILVTHLRDGNLANIPWRSTDEVVTAAECFYGTQGLPLSSDESHRRVRDLVKFAGSHFAREGRWEEAFRLLSVVPVPSETMDADLFRLRSTVLLYENRRVRKVRRVLLSIIGLVFLLVVLVSPLLFVFAEATHRSVNGLPPVRYADAIYWSVITFATVGYGDVVPYTLTGKILAMLNCLSGVTVMGVIAGLLLGSLTARKLS